MTRNPVGGGGMGPTPKPNPPKPPKPPMRGVTTLVLVAFLLAACGAQDNPPSPPGPLGISGDGWFWLILIALMVIGEVIGKFARRDRGGGR